MEKQDANRPLSPYGEQEYLLQVLELAREMMELSKRGTRFASDNGCLILYGVLRDCAFKIRKIAEEELNYHREEKENKED